MTLKPIGSETIALDTTTIKSFATLTKNDQPCSFVYLNCTGANVRFTDDPSFPLTTSAGMLLVADQAPFKYVGDFKNLRFLAASGTPNVFVHKYSGGVSIDA